MLGNFDPSVSVYDTTGRVIYATAPGSFLIFASAKLSPSGQYAAVTATPMTGVPATGIVRVVDVDSALFWDTPYLLRDGAPTANASGDGRFLITNRRGERRVL